MTKEINKTPKVDVNLSNVECVHILARRWFQRSYGNTYFSLSVDVEVNGKLIEVVNVPFEYGYGDHYDTVALQQFKKAVNIDIDLADYCYLSRSLKESGIKVYNHVSDVDRKKDL